MSLDELAAVRAALDAAPDRTQMTVEEIRAFYEMIAPPIDADDTTPVETLSIGAFKAEYSVPAGADTGAAILYFHGGGYALGSLNTHRRLARSLARRLGRSAPPLPPGAVGACPDPSDSLEPCLADEPEGVEKSGSSPQDGAGEEAP